MNRAEHNERITAERATIELVMHDCTSPVMSGLHIAKVVYDTKALTTNHRLYRRVMVRLWELDSLGRVCCYYDGGSNQRVWWLKERMK